jgi:hypothetical protein
MIAIALHWRADLWPAQAPAKRGKPAERFGVARLPHHAARQACRVLRAPTTSMLTGTDLCTSYKYGRKFVPLAPKTLRATLHANPKGRPPQSEYARGDPGAAESCSRPTASMRSPCATSRFAAGANPGSVTYHFTTKDGLLLEIYRRHCGPMNLRRSELLAAARRVRDLQDRLEAIVRAYVLPAFTSAATLPAAARASRGCAR